MAEPAEQTPVALVPQVVEADAFLLAVEVHYRGNVVTVLALVTTGAHALCEVKADLLAVRAQRHAACCSASAAGTA